VLKCIKVLQCEESRGCWDQMQVLKGIKVLEVTKVGCQVHTQLTWLFKYGTACIAHCTLHITHCTLHIAHCTTSS
jgi:hypothetical protein